MPSIADRKTPVGSAEVAAWLEWDAEVVFEVAVEVGAELGAVLEVDSEVEFEPVAEVGDLLGVLAVRLASV